MRPNLSIVTLEDRIVPAIPFSPAFPHALSITTGERPASNSTSFEVTFNQPVIGVDPSDFKLAPSGTVGGGIISSITGSGAIYTVNVTGIIGNGTMGLNLVDFPSITGLPLFETQRTFGTGIDPVSVVLGDVNNDGKLDCVTANFIFNGSVSVMLGNGNGSFQAQQTFATGADSASVALGDVNHDGKLDIVTANFESDNISVLFGNGDGTFQNQETLTAGNGPFFVVLGDVSGDGKLDIITANYNSDNVSLLLGNGDGTFQSQQTFAAGDGPASVNLGDINGDGKIDILTANANSNNVSTLLGNGNGAFQEQVNFNTGADPFSLKLGDVNRDGKLDIVTGDRFSSAVSILLNNGDGTFPDRKTFVTSDGPIEVTLGDINGDGKLDIITANVDSDNLGVLLGNGDGTFHPQESFLAFDGPIFATLGDVNSDGRLDIVTANFESDNIGVLLGSGGSAATVTFSPQQTFGVGDSPRSVSLGDLNGDGQLDIVTSNIYSRDISVLLGNGDGLFQEHKLFNADNPIMTALGDINGDGNLDIVTSNFGTRNTSVLLGNGNGFFQTQKTFDTGFYSNSLILGDVNGDGKLDIVVANFGSPSNSTWSYSASILLGNGDGSFQSQLTFALGNQPRSIVLGDVNGDSDLDIVASNRIDQNISILIGNGDGTFKNQITLGLGSTSYSIKLGDLNGDGRLDIVTANQFSNNTSVLLGNGDGTFRSGQNFTTGDRPYSVALGDLNGDGRLDIITANHNSDNTSIIINRLAFTGQAASISAPAPLVTGSSPETENKLSNIGSTVSLFDSQTGQPTGVAVPFPGFNGQIRVASGDFNVDGRTEIVAGAGPGGGPAVVILDSQTGLARASFFAYDQNFTGGVFVAVKDINNDGISDIITGAGTGGGPHVKVFNGIDLQEIRSFFAYAENFTGGVSVASADINGDGILDLVTGAGPGGGPHVKVFDGATNTLISQWFAYPPEFTGGVFVGMGDISNDGNFEVITGPGVGFVPLVAIWNPFTGELLRQFLAFDQQFIGGVRVGVSDATGDNILDLVTGAGPGGGPQVKAFTFPNLDLLFTFFSGPETNRQGVFVS